MEISVSFLLFTVTLIADPESTHAAVNLFQLESKIFNGNIVKEGEHEYMASLQLNNTHICSSGMFQKNFLITIALCAWHIAYAMDNKNQKATAVLGNINLKNGQRVNILKIAYQSSCKIFGSTRPSSDYDVGVVMLSDKVDYTYVKPVKLYEESLNLHHHKYDANVCGWGTVTKNDEKNIPIGSAEYSDNLHCMPLKLRAHNTCREAILEGDYKNKLICGESQKYGPGQMITMGDIGGPLMKDIKSNGVPKKYIIGLTLKRVVVKTGTLLRFLRTRAIYNDVQDMLYKLGFVDVENEDSDGGSQENFKEERRKRLKF